MVIGGKKERNGGDWKRHGNGAETKCPFHSQGMETTRKQTETGVGIVETNEHHSPFPPFPSSPSSTTRNEVSLFPSTNTYSRPFFRSQPSLMPFLAHFEIVPGVTRISCAS